MTNKEERTYDVVEKETGLIGRTAEAEDEDFVDGVSDYGVHFLLLRQRSQ